MPVPFGSFPFDAAGVDSFAHPQMLGPNNRPPTANDIQNPGTQWLDVSVNPPVIWETPGRGIWNQGGVAAATTTSFGTVELATLSQLQNGNAPAGAIVPLSNDVATVLAGIVVGAGTAATTASQGYVYLATNGMVVPTYTGTLGPNTVVPVSAIASMHAAPGPIGSVTPSTGAFTTLAASSNATVGGTLGVTGTSTLAALSATNGTFSGTLGVTGTSTLAALNATNGTFSGTLGVTGTTTIGVLSATNGTFSGTLGVTGTLTAGTLSITNLTISGTLGVTGASTFSSGTFSSTLGVTGLSTLAALTQLGTANINASGAGVTTIGTGGTGGVNIGNTTGNTAVTGALTVSTTLGITGLSTLAALTQVGTTNINASGAATTNIGIGPGTGQVHIGNATGNTVIDAGNLTATLGNIVASAGNITATLGSVSAGTTVTGGTGLIATTGGVTASAGNIVATLGNITASAGNIAATLGSVTAGTTVSAGTTITAGTGITATTGNIVASTGNITTTAGSITSATSLTATSGNITATAGNLVINGAAKQLQVHGGAVTDFIGTGVLVAGTVTIANTNIASTDKIFLTRTALNGTPAVGELFYTISAGASFTVTSISSTGTTVATDVTSFAYFIVRQV